LGRRARGHVRALHVEVPLRGERASAHPARIGAARAVHHTGLLGRPHHHDAPRNRHVPLAPTQSRVHGQGGRHRRLAVGGTGRPGRGRGVAARGIRGGGGAVGTTWGPHRRVPPGAPRIVVRGPVVVHRHPLHPSPVQPPSQAGAESPSPHPHRG